MNRSKQSVGLLEVLEGLLSDLLPLLDLPVVVQPGSLLLLLFPLDLLEEQPSLLFLQGYLVKELLLLQPVLHELCLFPLLLLLLILPDPSLDFALILLSDLELFVLF